MGDATGRRNASRFDDGVFCAAVCTFSLSCTCILLVYLSYCSLYLEKSSQARNYTFYVVIYSIFLTVFNHVFHISVLGLEGLGLDSDSLDIKDLNQLEAIINGNFDGNFDFQL